MGGWRKKTQHYAFFQDAIDFKQSFLEVLLHVPLRGLCLISTFPLSNKIVLRKTVLKTERKKGQQKHPVAVKGFQCNYVRNARAGAFHRSKMQSFVLVVPAPGPSETWGDQSCSLGVKALPRAMNSACLCESSSSAEHRTISSPPLTQGAMHGAS